jgi:quercetin dioxygenase-like cupin family protein
MTIKKIYQKLEQATNPVAQMLHKGDKSKVLVIGFKKGMILKEHTTDIPSKLTVLLGSVEYVESEQSEFLGMYDEKIIPLGVLHSVIALEDSLCLLTQG